MNRTQRQDAGLKAARCTFIAGFAATSNVLAGKTYGIPISGTMAHSYVTAFGVGTKLGVSADAPYIDIVYKLAKLGDRLAEVQARL